MRGQTDVPGVLRDHRGKHLCEVNWERGLPHRGSLSGGRTKGTPTHFRIQEGQMIGLGHHILRLRRTRVGVGPGPGLVQGGRALHREERRCTGVRLGCRSVQNPFRQTQNRIWGWGSAQGVTRRPGSRLGPTIRRSPPTTVSVRSLVLQGQPHPPPPGVQCSLRSSRPRGSIGWQRRAAPAPSLRLRPFPRSGCTGRGLRTASSRFRAAARPGSRPAREAETLLALPIRPAPLPRVLGEPDESELS